MLHSQPVRRWRARPASFGSLGDTCVNNTPVKAATVPASATKAPVSRTAIAVPKGAQLRGFGILPPGITGKGGTQGAVTGAATGASIGTTILPGIGTAIGAVIGAVAGGLIHTTQFASWLATDTNIINVLHALPSGFQGRTLPRQTPTAANPLTLEMIWTAIVVTGNMYAYNPDAAHSPSDMQNEFDWVMAWMLSILKCMNANPVGANLTVTCEVGNGVTFHLTFDNPGLSNTNTVAQTVMIPAYLAWCTHNNTVDTQSNHCPGDASNPVNQLALTLMTDYQIAQVNPSAGAVAPAKAAPIVTAGKTATVAVVTPTATTTRTAAKTTTVATPAKAATVAAPAATLYWLLNGNLGSGTVLPAGAIPLTSAQYTLMADNPSSPAALALYEQLMGIVIPSSATAAPDTAPISTLETPTINVSVPASAAPAIEESGIPDWVYIALAAGAVLLVMQSQKKK
jgi:Glycine zipper